MKNRHKLTIREQWQIDEMRLKSKNFNKSVILWIHSGLILYLFLKEFIS